MLKATEEFSRFAYEYDRYNIIQAKVAKSLIEKIDKQEYKYIIDIGSGSGTVYKNIKKQSISFEKFIALDSSKEMLDIHPMHKNIRKVCADFNDIKSYEILMDSTEKRLLLSSSALQWSTDLDFTFFQMQKLAPKGYFSIFTAGTFKTLHKIAQLQSPIHSTEELIKSIQKYYVANFEIRSYRLEFKSVREMFRYIKHSGVSGGKKQLRYKQIKKLMDEYPLNYLEFEVLFVEGESLMYL